MWPGKLIPPATKAAGTAPSTKSRSSLGLICPARAKRKVVRLATMMFRTSAVGFIVAGATANSAMIAR